MLVPRRRPGVPGRAGSALRRWSSLPVRRADGGRRAGWPRRRRARQRRGGRDEPGETERRGDRAGGDGARQTTADRDGAGRDRDRAGRDEPARRRRARRDRRQGDAAAGEQSSPQRGAAAATRSPPPARAAPSARTSTRRSRRSTRSSSGSRTAKARCRPFKGQLSEQQIQDVAAYVVASRRAARKLGSVLARLRGTSGHALRESAEGRLHSAGGAARAALCRSAQKEGARGGTLGSPTLKRRGRDLNPRRTFDVVRDFQSRSFGRSDTSPGRGQGSGAARPPLPRRRRALSGEGGI